ncbi:MAG: PQQ-dependent sugar dehydrogenase [Bradymonadia bacterium]
MPAQSATSASIRWGRTLTIALIAAGAAATGLFLYLRSPVEPPKGPAQPEGESFSAGVTAAFDGADRQRQRLAVDLTPVGQFELPTDIQFAPNGLMIVLQKQGGARWHDLETGEQGTWFDTKVLTRSEQGLLGLAFHPDYSANGKIYLNMVVSKRGKPFTRIQVWQMPQGASIKDTAPTPGPVLMDVLQPYANHNAGQVAFGPDGFLYVGLGDGGHANDPHDHGQNTRSFLGSMLRLDVDHPALGKPYGIPKDNPFVGQDTHKPEMWAVGLRNPWRYSFTPDGRLVTGDVGQNKWEEITFVPKGGNLGWRLREAAHCFKPARDCVVDGLTDPVYTYSHAEGRSVTGGFVATGDQVPALKGMYVFGDFVSGRLWAMKLPADDAQVKDVTTLGRWPISPSSFGRDAQGQLYVADFRGGQVYRLTVVR